MRFPGQSMYVNRRDPEAKPHELNPQEMGSGGPPMRCLDRKPWMLPFGVFYTTSLFVNVSYFCSFMQFSQGTCQTHVSPSRSSSNISSFFSFSTMSVLVFWTCQSPGPYQFPTGKKVGSHLIQPFVSGSWMQGLL